MTIQTTLLTNFDSVNPANIMGATYRAARTTSQLGAGQYVVENGKLYVHGDGLGYFASRDFLSMDVAVQANTQYTLSFTAGNWAKYDSLISSALLGVFVDNVQVNPGKWMSLPTWYRSTAVESMYSVTFTTGAKTTSVHLGIRDLQSEYKFSDWQNSFSFDNLKLSWDQPAPVVAPVVAPAPVVPPAPPKNWIVNADFEDGATGFTTGYKLLDQANGSGTAAVVSAVPTGWNMGSNAGYGGTGKFLMVDGSSDKVNTPTVWAEKITGLKANTHYDFSFQMMTNNNASTLAVKNNGVAVFTTSMADKQVWTEMKTDLLSNSSGEIDLSLVTVGNYNAYGNDLGLDHLSLTQAVVKNWIVNGDFDDGATGFATGYKLLAQAAGAGTAAVVTTPPTGWGMGNSTGYDNEGKFLMVDGSASKTNTPTVWAEKITGLDANARYDFSFQMMTNSNHSNLAVKSNGVQVFATSMNDNQGWTPTKTVLMSNSSGEIDLSLVTVENFNPVGNDFGLDHLSLVKSDPVVKNWIVNGDFEDGVTGFTTEYKMLAQAWGAGTAAVVTAPPTDWGTGATTGYGGAGKFLMVDGFAQRPVTSASPVVWAEKITGLEANADYDFSFLMMTNSNASTLAISSNGTVVGTSNLQNGRSWTQVQKMVTSNASGELSLSLATTAHYEALGNDFGLDHISLVRHVVL